MRLYSSDCFWGDILPRYSFLEPLVTGKRIIEIDCGDGSGVMYLHQCGASEVLGIEKEDYLLHKALERTQIEGVGFRSYDGIRIEAPTGAYDMVIGANLRLDADRSLLTEIQRVLHPTGYLVVALWNPRSVTWARQRDGIGSDPATFNLQEKLAGLQTFFPRLTVMSQKPFMGYAIGRMGVAPDEVSFEMDNGLVDDQEESPAFYLIACGRKPLRMDRHSLVQLPASEIINTALNVGNPKTDADEKPDPIPEDLLSGLHAERDELERKISRLEAENTELQKQISARDESLAGFESRLEQHLVRIHRLEHDLEARAEQSTRADQQSELDRTRLEDLGKENQLLAQKASGLNEKVLELEAELDRVRSAVDTHQQNKLSLEQKLVAFDLEKNKLESALQSARQEEQSANDRLMRFETQAVAWERLEKEQKARLGEKERELAVVQERLDRQTDKVTELQDTLSDQIQRYERLESDNLEMESRLNDSRDNEEKLQEKLSQAQFDLENHNRELKGCMEKVDSLTHEAMSSKEINQQLQDDLEHLRTEQQQWQKVERELRENLMKSEHERNLQSDTLTRHLQSSREENASQKKALENSRNELDALQKEMDGLTQQNTELENSLQQMKSTLQSLETYRDEARTAELEIGRQQEELEKQQQQAIRFEQELLDARNALEEERKQSRFAKEEIDNLRQEHRGWLDSVEREREQAGEHERVLKEKISQMSEQLDAADNEKEKLRGQIERLEQKLEGIEKDLASSYEKSQLLEESERRSQNQQQRITDIEAQLEQYVEQIQVLTQQLNQADDLGKIEESE